MKTLITLIATIALPLAVSGAAAQAPDADVDARGRALLAQFTDTVDTVTGRFSQTVTGSDGRIKERASGRFAIARPGRFEWVYTLPYEQRIVADGSNLWLHDIDLEQVSVRPQAGALGASPAGILGGGGDALDAFEYQGAFERDGRLWTQLAARDGDSDFRAVRIAFDTGQGTIAAMELGDSLSQRTLIEFSDVATDVEIGDSRFRFTPPPGADVTGTPAGGSPGPEDDAPADTTPAVPGLG